MVIPELLACDFDMQVVPGKASVSLYKCLSIFQEDELMHGSNSPVS